MIWDGIPNRERERQTDRDRETKRETNRQRERLRETERDPSGHLQWPYICARSSLFTRGHLLDLRGKKVLGIYDVSDKVYSTKHRCYCAGEQK